ncbi:MAG: cytochrome c oxidase subunit II [Bacteroidales bacterium]
MNSNASTFVEGVDNAFIFVLVISLLFLIGIIATALYFFYRYHHRRHPVAKQNHGSTLLEIIWTAIPIMLVMGMFYYGYTGWIPIKTIPDKGIEITANARMWAFSFRYENGRVADKLYVPRDTVIILELNAVDVIHSLYIPAFRVKEDMVPGLKNNRMWFEASKTGTYSIFCAEYCGLQHSLMTSEVVVMEPEEYWEWYADTTVVVADIPDEADMSLLGRQVLESKGCLACHSLDGSAIIGPTFEGRFGTTITVTTDGQPREIEYDGEYVMRSIYEPDHDISEGFRAGQMFSYEGEVTMQEIDYIIEFLKSLNE